MPALLKWQSEGLTNPLCGLKSLLRVRFLPPAHYWKVVGQNKIVKKKIKETEWLSTPVDDTRSLEVQEMHI